MFEISSFILIGILAGIIAGLLGVGGGIVTVPCLLVVFHYLGVQHDVIMQFAIGTSLAIMVFTSLAASYSHYKRQGIIFPVVWSMGIGIVIGSVLGAFIAKILTSYFLQIFFAVFEFLLGLRFLFPQKKREKDQHCLPHFFTLSTIGCGVSIIATLLGLGGGIFTVPILTYFHVQIKKAIGTSSMLSFVISLAGSLAFAFLRTQSSTENHESFGFIHIKAFIIISIVSCLFAPLGVKLASKCSTNKLRVIFGVALSLTGLVMFFLP